MYTTEGIRGLYKGSLLALVGVTNGSIQFAAYEAIKRQRGDLKRARVEKSGETWGPEHEMLVSLGFLPPSDRVCRPSIGPQALTPPLFPPSWTASTPCCDTEQYRVHPRFWNVQTSGHLPHLPLSGRPGAHPSSSPSLMSQHPTRSAPRPFVRFSTFALAHLPAPTPLLIRPPQNSTPALYPDIPTTLRRVYATQGLRGFYNGLGTNALRILPGTCAFFVAYENLSWLFRTQAEKRAGDRGE